MQKDKLPQSDKQAALQQQYALLETSQEYVGLVLASIMINYYVLEIQKQQLCATICQQPDPFANTDVFPLQITASILILSACVYFFDISQDAQQNIAENGTLTEVAKINTTASALVLIAAAIRTYSLFATQSQPEPPSVPEEAVLDDFI